MNVGNLQLIGATLLALALYVTGGYLFFRRPKSRKR